MGWVDGKPNTFRLLSPCCNALIYISTVYVGRDNGGDVPDGFECDRCGNEWNMDGEPVVY